jgi:integrase
LPEDPADPLRKAKLSPEMTLTEFYWSYYRPVCMEARGVKALTMYETEVSLKYWRDFTGDPQVGKITGLECANFVKSLNSLPGKGGEGSISPNTVRKHCKAIQALFDKLAPRGKENRLGTGLLADVPYLELPRARPKPPEDSFTVEEIGRWIEIANSAHLPNIMGIRPGAWWRSLILFCFNSGLRIGTVLELKWSMLEGNCLNVPGEIYKGGNAHRFYLSAHALAAIEPLRNLPGRPEKIFANPYKGQGPLQRIRLKMFKAADIPKTRRFGFHGLRKSAATEIARVNPEGARLLLGHSSLRTTIGHYIHPSLQAEVFQSLPQPVRVKIQTVEIETDI